MQNLMSFVIICTLLFLWADALTTARKFEKHYNDAVTLIINSPHCTLNWNAFLGRQ